MDAGKGPTELMVPAWSRHMPTWCCVGPSFAKQGATYGLWYKAYFSMTSIPPVARVADLHQALHDLAQVQQVVHLHGMHRCTAFMSFGMLECSQVISTRHRSDGQSTVH